MVRRCVRRESGRVYAAKFVHKRRRGGKDCQGAALREAGLLELARGHPRIVDIVEVYETRNEIVIVME